MTQVLVVVLGHPCAVLHEATRSSAPLATYPTLALRHVPDDVQAVSEMEIPSAFRLAWIFVNESALDSDALRACQQRLSRITPVTIAIHHTQGNLGRLPADLQFPGGAIFQPYTNVTFPLVLTLITDFATKSGTTALNR